MDSFPDLAICAYLLTERLFFFASLNLLAVAIVGILIFRAQPFKGVRFEEFLLVCWAGNQRNVASPFSHFLGSFFVHVKTSNRIENGSYEIRCKPLIIISTANLTRFFSQMVNTPLRSVF